MNTSRMCTYLQFNITPKRLAMMCQLCIIAAMILEIQHPQNQNSKKNVEDLLHKPPIQLQLNLTPT